MRKFLNTLKRSRLASSAVAVVLAFSVLLSTFGGLAIFASNTNVWDGQVATGFAGGDGTAEHPYEIANGGQLRYMIEQGAETAGKHYKLANDIYLNNVSNPGWYNSTSNHEWAPITDESKAFKGTFDGNGCVVYGLWANQKSTNTAADQPNKAIYAGLFPVIGAGATVSKVGVQSAYLSVTNSCTDAKAMYEGMVGGVVGYVLAATAENPVNVSLCYAGDAVKLYGFRVGGVIGTAANNGGYVYLSNSYSLVAESSTGCYTLGNEVNNRVGIFSGLVGGANISGCYGYGNICGTNNSASTLKNNYCTSWSANAGIQVSQSDILSGVAAKGKMPLLDYENVYALTSSNPVLRVFVKANTSTGSVWNGTEVAPTQGSGSESDPYIISTAEELAYAVANGGNGKAYKLTADIYLNDVTSVNWANGTAIGSAEPNEWYGGNTKEGEVYNGGKKFSGIIDGNGHTVYGLYYKPGSIASATGLIPSGNNATVKNLRIASSFISGGRWTSALIGYSTDTKISNVVIDTSVTIWGYDAGLAYYEGATGWPFVGSGTAINFESEALGAVVAYAVNSVNISNVASYATLKRDGFGFTISNNLINDGAAVNVLSPGHTGGIIGTAWNTAITVSDCISVATPFDGGNGNGAKNFSDVYTAGESKVAGIIAVSDSQLKGEDATNTLTGLDFEATWATTSSYPTLQMFNVMETSEYWSGGATAPTVGEGTKAKPFEISTAEELAYVVKNGGDGKYYKLTKDIYLNDVTRIDWTTGEILGGYAVKSWYTTANASLFNGTINGDGHVVYGLYSYTDGNKTFNNNMGAGLIHRTNGNTTITNLGIDKAYICYPHGTSAFIGRTGGNTTIDQCYVGANVILDGQSTGAFVGVTDRVTSITNCYSLATTIGDNTGLVGDNWLGPTTVSSCYNANGAIATKGHGIQTSTKNYSTVKGGTVTTVLTKDNMQGLDVLTNSEKMPALGDKFQATTEYPILAAFAPVKPAPEATVWDGTTKTKPSEGTGTGKNDPIVIYNAAELAYVVSQGVSGTSGKFYKLANDIYLNEVSKVNWATGAGIDGYTPNVWISGGFAGSLDGNGKVVYGLYNKQTSSSPSTAPSNNAGFGLFATAGDGFNVTKLGIDKAYVEYYTNFALGVMFGKTPADAAGTVSYSYVGKEVTVKGYDASAFFGGGHRGTGKNIVADHCYSLANISYTHRGGAFIGDTWGYGENNGSWVFSNCYTLGDFAYLNGNYVLSNCYASKGDGRTGLTIVADANMQGLDVFNTGKPMQKLNLSGDYQATETYPILDVFSANPDGGDGDQGSEPETDVDEDGIWTGKVLNTFSDNTSAGTKDDPIMLSTPGELALAIKSNGNGKYYQLADDMYLNDVFVADWQDNPGNNEWVDSQSFNGHIDGAGHIVYGVYFPVTRMGFTGFIGKMQSGSIKNLGIRYSYIQATDNKGAGGIIGWAQGGITIEQCFVDETVTVKSPTAGGIVGLAQHSGPLKISNCYSKVKLVSTLNDKYNGLIGNPWETAYEIHNSFSLGSKPYAAHMSDHNRSTLYWNYTTNTAKPGTTATDYFKNVYTNLTGSDGAANIWTTVALDSMYGDSAKTAMPALDYNDIWKTNEDGTPTLRVFGDKVNGEEVDTSQDAEVFAGGKGTKKSPYIIQNAEQLAYLVQSATTSGKYYKLANDIYVNDTSKSNWKATATLWFKNLTNMFEGTLDGDGHAIYGLYMNETPYSGDANYQGSQFSTGLFPRLSGKATIRNLHIRNSYLSGYANVGAFGGHLMGSGNAQFVGCSVDETVTLRGLSVGGFVGSGGGVGADIMFCYSTADVQNCKGKGNERANAFIADVWGASCNINGSYAQGNRLLRGDLLTKQYVYSDTYSSGAILVSKSSMYGSAAKKAMPKLNWDVFYTVNGKTPQLRVVPEGLTMVTTNEGVKGKVWTGSSATKFAGGTGTESDPYLIETAEQLYFLASGRFSGTKNTYYKLMANIKLNDTSKTGWQQTANEWCIGTKFYGQFDGNGYVVSGLYYSCDDAGYCGLFPFVGASSTIKRVGLVSSYLRNDCISAGHTYAGGIAGFVENWDGYQGSALATTTETAPVFSECFVGSDVTIKGDTVGGILGGTSSNIEFYNCYAVCALEYSYRAGGICGDGWEEGAKFSGCYVATANRDSIAMGPIVNHASTVYESCYLDGSSVAAGKGQAYGTNLYYMQGDAAKTHMPDLNYTTVYKTVSKGTPTLRCFRSFSNNYVSMREPQKVSISFVVGEGATPLDPIYGYPEVTEVNVEDFPIPERYGYVFAGWYHFAECDLPFSITKFPNFNAYAYAKWVPAGFTQGFETDTATVYDVNAGAEFFQPGVTGYNPRYIHGGLRSAHILPDAEVDGIFLLYYKTKLEIGQKYDVNFYMTAKESGTSGYVEFIHTSYADANDTAVVGSEKVLEFENLTGGKWEQYKVTITANAPYILVRVPKGTELFFDDFQVVPNGEEGELGKLEGYNPGAIASEPTTTDNGGTNVWVIVAIVAGGVVLLAAIATVTIVIVSKKKKAKKSEPTE